MFIAPFTARFNESHVPLNSIGQKPQASIYCEPFSKTHFVRNLCHQQALIHTISLPLCSFHGSCSTPFASSVASPQALAADVSATSNGRLVGRQCDVTNESEVVAAFAWIRDNLGGVDVFVNNAGCMKAAFVIGKPETRWIYAEWSQARSCCHKSDDFDTLNGICFVMCLMRLLHNTN